MIGIDLFAGAGGMSLGARQVGIDVQIVVEADKYAAQTYQRNHTPNVLFHEGDIRTFTKVDLVNPADEQVVLFGGPPCQGFSTSNQKTRNSENPVNWLFTEFLRVVDLYEPEWIVFENVKGILETEGGLFAQHVLDSISSKGYICESTVLKASEFGVPQNRDRFFIVANRIGASFKFPKGSNKLVTVEEAIGDLPKLRNGANKCERPYEMKPHSEYSNRMRANSNGHCLNNLVTRNAKFVIARYKYIPQGGNWENVPDRLMTNYKDKSRCHTGIYHRLSEDKPSVVIGNYRKNMLIHPSQGRGLSVREAARLQSFPDDFIFEGSIGFQQQQVGNAVPPLLAQELFKRILNS
ncbi:MAG: DNA (cytosine-5)-methyltransferase 1 [Colwellia sp.]|jgi:DNA (cytosine-5)-methyltransferase 1